MRRCDEVLCLVAAIEGSLEREEFDCWVHSAQGHVAVQLELANELIGLRCELFARQLDPHGEDVLDGLSHHFEDFVFVLGRIDCKHWHSLEDSLECLESGLELSLGYHVSCSKHAGFHRLDSHWEQGHQTARFQSQVPRWPMWKGLQLELVKGVCVDEELLEGLEVGDRELVLQQLQAFFEVTTSSVESYIGRVLLENCLVGIWTRRWGHENIGLYLFGSFTFHGRSSSHICSRCRLFNVKIVIIAPSSIIYLNLLLGLLLLVSDPTFVKNVGHFFVR